MSTEEKTEGVRGKLKVPRLSEEAQKWAETCIATGLPYTNIVQAFLETFPYYLENATVTEKEVRDILHKKFVRMRGEKRRVSYFRIKQKREELKEILDCYPVASPLVRLEELEVMRQDKTLTVDQRSKVLSGAHREQKMVLPPESRSPFEIPGVPVPDLTVEDSEETSEEATHEKGSEKQRYEFGGAMSKRNQQG